MKAMKKPAVVVPARLGSQRFPRKLLYSVQGEPLILWTARNLSRAVPDWPLYFAVGEEELADVLGKAGYEVLLTDPHLPSGTDRLAAANQVIGADWVINAQADEPLLQERHLRQLWQLLQQGAEMATLASRFQSLGEFRDPNKVKVVLAAGERNEQGKDPDAGRALYFSRAPIPFFRDRADTVPPLAFWHLGLYGYSAGLLEAFPAWPKGRLEELERLEQLRVLENGREILVGITRHRTVGVDVMDDLPALEQAMAATGRDEQGT